MAPGREEETRGAEQRGAHGPTWKGKQCEIKEARDRKQLVVQIIIAAGRARRRFIFYYFFFL